MPHPTEIISLPTILSSLALFLAGMISLAMVSLFSGALSFLLALAGSAALISSLYFLQLEIRIYLLACKQYEEDE